MLWRVFADGFGIGLSIAAPVGPIGALCIRKTLVAGRTAGVVAGLGAATADACYGLVAGCGLTAVSSLLLAGRFWLGLLGGGFLIWLGVKTLLARPAKGSAVAPEGGLLVTYLSTLVLTLANPMTILSFVAIFAGLGVGAQPDYGAAVSLVAGVFAGSAVWWLFLAAGVGALRSRAVGARLGWLNTLSGLVLVGFGVRSLVTALR